MMLVFFDTEFTELGIDPRLISIGLVAEDGERTFYAELSDTYRLADVGEFARMAVLPQLQGGAALRSMQELGQQLAAWLEAFGEPVKLATDSLSWDWPWIHEIFGELGTWPVNLDGKPLVFKQTPEFCQAVERAFARGLRRHHALDDAKANRLAWLNVERLEVRLLSPDVLHKFANFPSGFMEEGRGDQEQAERDGFSELSTPEDPKPRRSNI